MKKFEELIWTEESITRFWDWQSQFPENYFTYQFGEQIAEQLAPYLRGADVLDYGCGVGHLLPHLCKYAANVCAADTSTDSVITAKQKMRGCAHFEGVYLLEELTDLKKKFGVVVVVEVIEHLHNDHLNELLKNIRNLLSENGVVIFTTPNNEDLSKSMTICPESGKVFHKWQHVRSWNAESLPRYLREHGFEIVDVAETNFAKKRISTPIDLFKAIVKRAIHGRPGKPHLRCAAKIAELSAARGE